MTGLVGALEATGAVGRTPCAHHGRVIEVSLTPAGVGLLARADGLVDQVEGVVLSGLSPQERRQLPGMLDRCLTALERGLS
jgi:DNA-binding MarR family transcriptional regulator